MVKTGFYFLIPGGFTHCGSPLTFPTCTCQPEIVWPIHSWRSKGRGQVVSIRISHLPLIHTPPQNWLTHIPGQKTEGRGQVTAGNEHGCGDVKSKIGFSIMYQINIFYD